MAPPAPRRFAAANWRGLHSLVRRGLSRYFKMAWHTLGGPCISSLLLLAVFVLAAGGAAKMAPGLALAEFLVPGIVMFQLAHAAFENAAFPVLDDKLEGMIGDILAAPLSPLEILAGYVLPAVVSGLMTGTAILGLGWLFADLRLHDPGALLGFALGAALLFALLGAFVGLWADRWEQYAIAETFLILPLGFLSGTFFTISSLPEAARPIIALNPVFHAVGGLRYALTGYLETALLPGSLLLGGLILFLWMLLWRLFAVGYKLKP